MQDTRDAHLLPSNACRSGNQCVMKHAICEHITDAAVLDYAERSRKRRVYDRRDKVYKQGENSDGIYCIQSGYLLLRHVDENENETAFRMVGPGDIVGYRSLFANQPHAATAQALTTCYICFYKKASVESMIASSSALARRFLQIIGRDPGPQDALLLRGQRPLRVRLIYLLMILRKFYGEGLREGNDLRFSLPITRLQIAALLGARPESVTRAIKELEQDGILLFHGKEVNIPDLETVLTLIDPEAVRPEYD